jgi:hypothetical protein
MNKRELVAHGMKTIKVRAVVLTFCNIIAHCSFLTMKILNIFSQTWNGSICTFSRGILILP